MAPEVFDRRYDKRADVYSFSIVLWEALTLKRAFSHLPHNANRTWCFTLTANLSFLLETTSLSVCLSVCLSQRPLSLNDISLSERRLSPTTTSLSLPLSLATNCASLNELLKQPLFLSKQRLLSPPLPPLSNQFSLQVSYYRHLISARTRCICTEGRASAPRHNQGGAYPRGAC